MPPPNISLAYGLFQAGNSEGPKDFHLSPDLKKKKKKLDREPVPRLSSEISTKNMGYVWWRET